jgi:carbohydrate kinase (thermoresistant glucokinase family)
MPQVRLVYLKGSYELILQRMQARPGHFFQPEMLESQFAALEEPQHAWVVDIDKSPEAIVNEIVRRLEDETGIREAGEDPP